METGIAYVIGALARQNADANRILFQVATRLTLAQLEAARSPSRESADRLLVHVLTAEVFYLRQLGGVGPTFNAALADSLDGIAQFAAEHHDRLLSFITRLSAADLAREVPITFSNGAQYRFLTWQVLLQVFGHSAQHRGELSIVLSELGHPLPIDDIIVRFAQESGQPWPPQVMRG